MHITFLAPAEAELLNAVAYYNSQSEGLGYEFASEVKRTIERIVQYPEACFNSQTAPAGAEQTDSPMELFIRLKTKMCLSRL